MNGLELIDRNFCNSGKILHQKISIPINAREIAQQIVITHLVIVAFNVALFRGRKRNLCNACFDGKHIFHLLRSICRRIAHKLEKLLDIFLVTLAHFHRLRIIIEIIVAIAKRKATLVDLHQIQLSIFEVGRYAHFKERRHP